MATTSHISPKIPLSSLLPALGAEKLSPHARAIAERIHSEIWMGEMALILSGIAAVSSMGFFTATFVFKASLFLPGVAAFVAAAVMGAWGQVLLENAEEEMKAAGITDLDVRTARVFQPGQPIGLFNEGNTCFINATFQMIMNDEVLCRALHESFEREIVRHSAFCTLIQWMKEPNTSIFTQEMVPQVLGIFQNAKSELNPLLDQFPHLKAALQPNPALNLEDLMGEFVRVNETEPVKQLILSQERAVKARLDGFGAFLNGEAAYRQAERDHTLVAPLNRTFSWSGGELLNALRSFVPDAEEFSQEDACDLLLALLNWVPGSEYPGLFFSKGHEREWKPYVPVSDDEGAALAVAMQQKIDRAAETGLESDRLSPMPADHLTRKMDGHACVITVDLVEGVSGQELLNRTLMMQDPPEQGDHVPFVEGWFDLAKERTVLDPLPTQFILALKRFKKGVVLQKIRHAVEMPLQITIGGGLYSLRSIVEHQGGTFGGHYISYVNKENRWWQANDRDVDAASPSDVMDGLNNGYLYCYEKILEESRQQPDDVLIGEVDK